MPADVVTPQGACPAARVLGQGADGVLESSAPVSDAARLPSRLVILAVAVTLLLLPLGAWVRLTDAGLGCPDWPGCYGHWSPAQAAEPIAQAVAAQGGEHGPVSLGKAWREMVHRYVAASLGLLLMGIAAIAVARRRVLQQSPALPLLVVGVVVLQGVFGKWTVTMLLRPAIVTAHLLGGMTVLALLVWLAIRGVARMHPPLPPAPLRRLRMAAGVGLASLAVQIALGGWVSTNHAALACTDLPLCQGAWFPAMNFGDAFPIARELGRSAEGAGLPIDALTAIHWTHRVGALAVALWLGGLAWATARAGASGYALALASALVLQVGLGAANVLLGLPLSLAVAHNAGAAVLLAVTVALNSRLHHPR